ncbi:MAG: hypothetical protein PVI21_06355 [Candidatus Woesebacteria bacterium]|jgi:hypothetical protein
MKFLRKIPKSLRIFLSVELVIAVVAILAFYIPLSMSSGVERFEGDERKAAEYYFKLFDEPADSIFPSLVLKEYVVDVKEVIDSSQSLSCKVNGRTGRQYTIYISERTIFGISLRELTYPSCAWE